MSNYNVKTIARTAVPRSKRLREGAAPEGSQSSGGSAGGGGGAGGNSHSHTNKEDLDRIRVEGQYIKVYIDVEQGGEFVKELVSAKAGYADTAGEAAHALEADEADHALEADHAEEADNADTWDNHQFDDYLDQAVKSTSNVIFAKVTTPAVESQGFTSGPFGSGFQIAKKADGDSYAEVDHLTVRKTMKVYELIIQQLKHQGGIVFYTAASLEISKVEAVSGGYKCYFDTEDGQIPNEFAVGDQARCQRFNLGTTQYKYYWRLVTAVGADYVVLSVADCDAGSAAPAEGDIIVQLGNRTDAQRQSAKVTTTIGNNAPRDEYYQGINSYDLTGKLVTVVGNNEGTVGIFTEDGRFSGKVQIGAGSSGLENLNEWAQAEERISDAEDAAADAQTKINGLLAVINDDSILDLIEKRSLRVEWVAINGIESTSRGSQKGSYYQVKHEFESGAFPFEDSVFEYNGRTFTFGDKKIVFKVVGMSALDAAYLELREFLASVRLNDREEVTYNFDRTKLADLLTHYYDCETHIRDIVSKTIDKKVDDTKQEILGRLETYQTGVEAAIEDLQEQIDNAITTWYHSGVPTLSNYPVVGDPEGDWDTPEKKKKHIGDLYYDKDTGHGYRFLLDGSTYKWEIIRDEGVAEALAAAAAAQDTADQKRRVFLAAPTAADAYDEGDMWLHATAGTYNNETLVCKTAKAAGIAFNIAHWEKASKYTDDTVANLARDEAAAADAKAATARTEAAAADAKAVAAQNTANAATSKLTTWASDSYINPTEKEALKQQLKDVQKEYEEICYEAARYSGYITDYASKLNAYTAAYNTAVTAFNKYTASSPAEIPVGSDYAGIAAYYDARAIFTKSIALGAKARADEAAADAAAAQSTADTANAKADDGLYMLGIINNDTILDRNEKAALRTEWVAINGIESTSRSSTKGSYYTARQHGLKIAANAKNLSYNGKTLTFNGKTITFNLAGLAALDAAYLELREYLASVGLNDRMSDTRNFDRSVANEKLCNYHDAEDAVYVYYDDETKALIENSGSDTKDDIARKLGYRDWAAMVEAAQAGKTIISGGYLQNSLIDTETLAANNALIQTLWNQQAFINRLEAVEATVQRLTVGKLDTLPSDTKSKIQAEGNQIVMLDASGKKKFRVFDGYIGVYDDLRLTKDLNYLSSPLSLTRSIGSYVAQSGTPQYLPDELVGFLNMGWCDKGSTLQINSIRIQLTVPYDTNGRSINYYSNAPSYRVVLYNSDGSAVQSWTCSPGSPTYGSSGTTITATLSLNTTITISEDSSYTLRVYIYRNQGPVVQTSPVYWTSPYGSANVNLSYNTSFYIKLTRSNYEYTHIGRDGLMQVFGDGYLFSDGTDFVVKRGVYMLRLKAYTGIQKSTNGGQTWTSL